MPQLEVELTPELRDAQPLFEEADMTGPSFNGAPNLWQVFTHAGFTGSIAVDMRLPLHGTAVREVRFAIYAQPIIPPTLDLRDTIDMIRRITTLPVNEVATMMGLKRRALYKIVEENSTSAQTEQQIHRLAALVERLRGRLHESRLIRTALLMPISTLENRSLIEIAASRDDELIEQAVHELLSDPGRRAVNRQSGREAPLTDSGETARAALREATHTE